MSDDFTTAARRKAFAEVGEGNADHLDPVTIWRLGASWARDHLAAQEPTDAEVEAAAEALHYAQGFDDWGVANSYEREEARGLARAALAAARRDETEE